MTTRQLITSRVAGLLPIAFLSIASIASIADLSFATARWNHATPFGGNVVALAQAPSAPQTLYAFARPGGLFVSLDGGATWSPGAGLPADTRVLDLLVAPRDPRTVYSLTGADSGSGLLRSRDGGHSWSAIDTGSPVSFLAADGQHPNLLYAGTWSGVRRSRNAGDSWEQAGFAGLAVTALAVDPRDTATLLAAVRGSDGADRVWRSGDGGQTWTATPLVATPVGFVAIRRLVFDPVRPGTAWALSTAELQGQPGVFRTTDGGVSWSLLSATGIRDLTPAPDGLLFAAIDRGIARSSDLGDTWVPPLPISSPHAALPPDAISQLLVSAGSPETLIAAGSEGIWKSASAGASWDASNQGLLSLGAYSLAVAPVGPDLVIAVVGDGVFRSSDHGRTWRRVHSAGDGPQPGVLGAFDPRHPRTIYGIGFGQADSLLKSVLAGRDWSPLPVPYTCGGDSICDVTISAFALDPGNPDTVFVGGSFFFHFVGGGVFLLRSDDGGQTWQSLTNPPGTVQALVIDPNRPAVFHALTCTGLFTSRDAGATWRKVGRGLPQPLCGPALPVLALDPEQPSYLYVGTPSHGVFGSSDGGSTFHAMDRGLESAQVATILIDPTSSARLYAGAVARGVFRWSAHLQRWLPLNEGLPSQDFAGVLALDPRDPSILYAGTQTQGVFRLDLSP